ncbi:MAG: hypothetical protein M3405_06895 [Acidobacteriota bacterium]|jgi:hypothetical protein|nr:hypothetical protein [Acidobacteriota bacterium]
MKTAISVPDDIFELSEKLAKQLKVSRSKIFAMGVKKLAEEYDDDEITKQLNEFYENDPVELDPIIMQMALMSLPKEEW